MSIREIGCCGAYCKTCPELINKRCRGCKLGYETGERDINKARCKIKVCCFKERKFETCADCSDSSSCRIIQEFHSKSGYKYKKYKQAIEFIRENGYEEFIRIADNWKNAYGKYVSADYLKRIAQHAANIKKRSYELMNLQTDSVVLDMGCCPASDTIPLAGYIGSAGKIVGIDMTRKC
jgi:hypothetical protein